MNNKSRLKKLEARTGTGEGLITEISIDIINTDGTLYSKLVSKYTDGIWSKLCETIADYKS